MVKRHWFTKPWQKGFRLGAKGAKGLAPSLALFFALGAFWGLAAQDLSQEKTRPSSKQKPSKQKPSLQKPSLAGDLDKAKVQQGARYVWRKLHQAMPLLWPSVRLELTAQSGYSAGTHGAGKVRVSQDFLHWLGRHSRDEREFRGFVAFVLAHELAHVRRNGPNELAALANTSQKSSQKKPSLQREAAADSFGAMALITLSYDELLPVRLFRLLRQRSQGSGEGRGFAVGHLERHLGQREILYLRRLGHIKQAGLLFRIAMDDLLSAEAKLLDRAVASLGRASRLLKQVDLHSVSFVDYALATAHHRLWLIRGNDPHYLLVRPSFYTPQSMFATVKAGAAKKVLGNRYNYHKARRYYTKALELASGTWRTRIELQRALLLMYLPQASSVRLQKLLERSLQDGQSCFAYNNAAALALYGYGQGDEGGSFSLRKKDLNRALAPLRHCLDSDRLAGQTLLRKKIYYHLALAAKLQGREQYLRRWRQQLESQPGTSKAWLSVLLEKTQSMISQTKPRDRGAGEWLSSLKKKLPFALEDSWQNVQQRLRLHHKKSLALAKREAGGWLFVRVKVRDKLYYRLFFNQEKNSQVWRLVRASLSRVYLRKLGQNLRRKEIARLGQPAQQKGGWLFYPDYGLHLRYGLNQDSSQLQEVTLSLN